MILLVVIFFAIGFNCQAWLAGKPNRQVITSFEVLKTHVESTSTQRGSVGEATVLSSIPQVNGRPGLASRGVVAPARIARELSADSTALVAEMCDLQLLANGTELGLDSRQWSALAAVVLHAQAVRLGYEARIAISRRVAPGRYEVEIPMYAGAGDLLRANFNADLRKELGQATAAEVMAKIGDRLEGRFAGFGVSAQTLEITTSMDGFFGDISVMRTATYWNSVEGADLPTTRREMHFPVWEDPTGDSWAALLAIVKA